MTKKNSGRSTMAATQAKRNKDNQSTLIINKVKQLLTAGGKYSAKQINTLCNINSARQTISNLIKYYHLPICNEWHQDGYKLYWYDAKQLENHCNDNRQQKNICRVEQLLSAGGKYTARQINTLCNIKDARNCISILIKDYHLPICKEWHQDGYKLYWYGVKNLVNQGKEACNE